MLRGIRFIRDEPALIATCGRRRYLVVSDLHIGMELKLSAKGVHLYGATKKMSERILGIMGDAGLDRMIMLGDVKENFLRPEAAEARLIRSFFDSLKGMEVTVTAGNHDAMLADIVDVNIVKNLRLGRFYFAHGYGRLGETGDGVDCILMGHMHPAIETERNGIRDAQKVWCIYKEENGDKRLVSVPAFNDLIIGTDVNKYDKLLFASSFRRETILGLDGRGIGL